MKKLRLIIIALSCAFSAFGQHVATGTGTTLYAFRNFQADKPSSYVTGPVTFNSDDPSVVNLIADQTTLGRIYAGEYVNYKWYALITKPGTQSSVEGLAEIDMLTGARKMIATNSKAKQLTDMTYDYTTNTMYGIASSAEQLATIDLKTAEVTIISSFKNLKSEEVYPLTLACDLDGELYAICTNDTLYNINKENAVCTPIGNVGADAIFTQTMAFDHNTRTLYWASNGDYTLYTVNIKTGKATSLGEMGAGGGDSMGSLFIPFINVSKGAPDRVTERKTESYTDKTVISWKYPAIDAQGNNLTELTNVYIYRDNELIQTLSLTAGNIGQTGTYTDNTAAKGKHLYRIVCENSKGKGGKDDDDLIGFVGENAPGAVKNFSVVSGDNVALLSWETPTEGAFGGPYNANDLKGYLIYRTKDGEKTEIKVDDPAAIQYTDEAGFGHCAYSIAAVNSVGTGMEASVPALLVKPSDWIIMSNGTYTVTEGKFYDTGGPNGNYKNLEKLTMTLKPALPNSALVAEFTEFSLDNYGDTLYIYDGINTSSKMIGKYSALSLPADLKRVVATNNEGALTFYFNADVMYPDKGWSANISCIQKKEQDLSVSKVEGTFFPTQNSAADYTVTLQNLGMNRVNAADYKIQLVDENNQILAQADGVDVNSMEVKKVIVKLTATNSGTLKMKGYIAYEGDNDLSNNSSDYLTLNVQKAGSYYVSIGKNSPTLAVLPVTFYSVESLGEMLYNASEINVPNGMLEMISFPMKADLSYDQLNIKVWIAETEQTNLGSGNIFAKDMTQVYEGLCPITSGDNEWIIRFDNPFEYSGKNLVVLIQKNGENTANMGVSFCGIYGTYGDPIVSCFTSSEEPLDPNVDMGEYSTTTMHPDINMLFTQKESGISNLRTANSVNVYPSPFRDVINIDSNCALRKATLTNVAGEIMLQSTETRINASSLSKGIYILTVVTEDGQTIQRKVIKDKE